MSQTYDPIVERTDDLQRLRIIKPLRAPELGTAIVLERAVGAPVVVGHGDRVPDARTGHYRRMYLVDVANRSLSFTVNAPAPTPRSRSPSPSGSPAGWSTRWRSYVTACAT